MTVGMEKLDIPVSNLCWRGNLYINESSPGPKTHRSMKSVWRCSGLPIAKEYACNSCNRSENSDAHGDEPRGKSRESMRREGVGYALSEER